VDKQVSTKKKRDSNNQITQTINATAERSRARDGAGGARGGALGCTHFQKRRFHSFGYEVYPSLLELSMPLQFIRVLEFLGTLTAWLYDRNGRSNC
jgi:hypothetical protein